MSAPPGARLLRRIVLKTVFSRADAGRTLGGSLRLRIDPQRVAEVYDRAHYESELANSLLSWRDAHRFIRAGDWDQHRQAFESIGRVKHLRDLYAHREDFTQSARYIDLVAALDAGKPKRGFGAARHDLASREGIERYCRYYVDLMNAMRDSGWRDADGDETCKVAVARDGTVLKWPLNGFHRLAAARIVGLPWMTVEVVQVHADWARQFGASMSGRGAAALAPALQALGKKG